jgi:hypothetical protein
LKLARRFLGRHLLLSRPFARLAGPVRLDRRIGRENANTIWPNTWPDLLDLLNGRAGCRPRQRQQPHVLLRGIAGRRAFLGFPELAKQVADLLHLGGRAAHQQAARLQVSIDPRRFRIGLVVQAAE